MGRVVGIVFLGLLLSLGAAVAGPIEELAGYWSGGGTVKLANGSSQHVKCAVTYRVEGGARVRQSMRCAAADYSINASADLSVTGARVTGSWVERTYSAEGHVSGRYSGNAMTLSIEGASFTASMNLELSNCKQSISIAPRGLEVTHITISLAKC